MMRLLIIDESILEAQKIIILELKIVVDFFWSRTLTKAEKVDVDVSIVLVLIN